MICLTSETATAPEPQAVSNAKDAPTGKPLDERLSIVKCIVRAHDGRLVFRKFNLSTEEGGEEAQVDKKNVTAPRWKIDQHPHWGALKENDRAIKRLLSRYTVSDAIPGMYVIANNAIGRFMGELLPLCSQRQALANEMRLQWDDQVVPAMVNAIGTEKFNLYVRPKLPNPDSLADRFTVDYCFYPLAPLAGDEIDLSAMDPRDAEEIRTEVNGRAAEMLTERFESVANAVLDQTLKLCDEIAGGSFESGKRRGGALQEVMDILERVGNFGEFADEAIREKVHEAKQVVGGMTVQRINSSHAAQQAMKEAFSPLAAAIRNTQSTFVARDIEI